MATSCEPSGMLVLPLSEDVRIEKLNWDRYASPLLTFHGQSIHAMCPALLLAV